MTRAIITLTESFDLSSLEDPNIGSMIPNDFEYTFLCDATAGPIVVTLLSVNNVDNGRAFSIKKIDSSQNLVTIIGSNGELIDDLASQDIRRQFACFTVQADSPGYCII